jgi:hypothetical protein
LIPGATSAGLATAYKEMKVSFDQPIFWSNVMFYVSIAGLVITSFGVVGQPNLDAPLWQF